MSAELVGWHGRRHADLDDVKETTPMIATSAAPTAPTTRSDGNVVELPRVSVVIPAYNEEAAIVCCLTALVDQTVPAFEIIVVDNRSTDATAGIVTRFAESHPAANIRVLEQNAEQGITPTRNAGFDAAAGDIIARIDADSIVERDWVDRIASIVAPGRMDAVSGPVGFHDLPGRRFTATVDRVTRRLTLMLSGGHTFLFGSNMALTREAWHMVRDSTCADHADLFHEDLDLAVHIERTGFLVGYDTSMRVAISGRRATTSRADFFHYLDRLDRTYTGHGMDDRGLRTPAILMRAGFPLLRMYARGLIGIAVRPSVAVNGPAPLMAVA